MGVHYGGNGTPQSLELTGRSERDPTAARFHLPPSTAAMWPQMKGADVDLCFGDNNINNNNPPSEATSQQRRNEANRFVMIQTRFSLD